MAQLTRKFLRALGVEDDKIDEIVNAHQDTLEEIRTERDGLKESSGKLAQAQAEVIRLTEALEKAEKHGGDAAKVQADFDAFRQQVEKEKTHTRKLRAYDALLKDAGVARDSFRQTLCKTADMEKIELDDKGAVKDAEALKERIRADYADFIGTVHNDPTPTITPPSGGGKTFTAEQIRGMSEEEINKNWESVSKTLASLK